MRRAWQGSGLKTDAGRIEVTFDIAVNGILDMAAKNLDIGRQVKITGIG